LRASRNSCFASFLWPSANESHPGLPLLRNTFICSFVARLKFSLDYPTSDMNWTRMDRIDAKRLFSGRGFCGKEGFLSSGSDCGQPHVHIQAPNYPFTLGFSSERTVPPPAIRSGQARGGGDNCYLSETKRRTRSPGWSVDALFAFAFSLLAKIVHLLNFGLGVLERKTPCLPVFLLLFCCLFHLVFLLTRAFVFCLLLLLLLLLA